MNRMKLKFKLTDEELKLRRYFFCALGPPKVKWFRPAEGVLFFLHIQN